MENEQNSFEEGRVLAVDKPYGWSSFKAVKVIKRITGAKKIGHAGTLDPLATGLLIMCTGKFTKRLSDFQDQQKKYSGTFVLGATTPSFDLETEVRFVSEVDHLEKDRIKKAVDSFLGEQDQTPPAYSAVKVDGKRAYKMARTGEQVTIRPKPISIYTFKITKMYLPKLDFEISCSKGTYIRSIARDLGEKLEVGAYLSALRRDQIGDISVKNAKTPAAWRDFLTSIQVF